MLKLYKVVLATFLFSPLFSQLSYNIVSHDEKSIIVDITFSSRNFSYKTINDINYIDFQSIYKVVSLEKGAPALPIFGSSYRVPSKGKINIEIIKSEIETVNISSVLPSKGNLKRNINPTEIPYTFSEVYQKNEFYPNNILSFDPPSIFRTIRIQNLKFYPYQYNPITNILKINKKVRVKISTDIKNQGVNEVYKKINNSDLKSISCILKNENMAKYTAVEEDGEMLIITPPSKQTIITNLANWKNQKGIKTVVKTTDETGQTKSEITAFLDTYYAEHPNFKYLLLVGDYNDIPTHSYGTNFGEQLFSDSYYGQLAGSDYYPDVFVGRLSGTDNNIQTMVNRIIEYEKSPLLGTWTKKAIGMGSGEGAGYGDENEADWQHERGLRDYMINFGYQQVYEFYDGSRGGDDANGSPTPSDVSNALNDGVGILNYTGHGDVSTFVTSGFSSSNVNQLSNNGKYPFVISVACNHGTFVNATCISESWLNASNNNGPTGAIAACGSSILMAWAPPMETQDELTLINTKNKLNNYKTTLGALFYNAQMSMLESYGQDGVEVMQTWIFFGDPSVVFRNDNTQTLTANHVQHISANIDNTVNILSDIEDADVALSVNYNLLAKTKINGGNSTFNLTSLPEGTIIDVVVSKQNYIPYIGQILVVNTSSINEHNNYVNSIYPNPVNDELNITLNDTQISQILLFNIDGKLVNQFESFGKNIKINLSDVSDGIYYLKLKELDKYYTYKIVKN